MPSSAISRISGKPLATWVSVRMFSSKILFSHAMMASSCTSISSSFWWVAVVNEDSLEPFRETSETVVIALEGDRLLLLAAPARSKGRENCITSLKRWKGGRCSQSDVRFFRPPGAPVLLAPKSSSESASASCESTAGKGSSSMKGVSSSCSRLARWTALRMTFSARYCSRGFEGSWLLAGRELLRLSSPSSPDRVLPPAERPRGEGRSKSSCWGAAAVAGNACTEPSFSSLSAEEAPPSTAPGSAKSAASSCSSLRCCCGSGRARCPRYMGTIWLRLSLPGSRSQKRLLRTGCTKRLAKEEPA
mmetsp:Transcript_147257/g.455519  ORF Transcript_147257/g.455519 Transcript_147257/m.455519 type:complete len:304 (+) Transcript_147257:466-1377(+)